MRYPPESSTRTLSRMRERAQRGSILAMLGIGTLAVTLAALGGYGYGSYQANRNCEKDKVAANAAVKVHKAEDTANTKILTAKRSSERKTDTAYLGGLKAKVIDDAKTLPLTLLDCRIDDERLRNVNGLIRAANEAIGLHGATATTAAAGIRGYARTFGLDRHDNAAVRRGGEKSAVPDRLGKQGEIK